MHCEFSIFYEQARSEKKTQLLKTGPHMFFFLSINVCILLLAEGRLRERGCGLKCTAPQPAAIYRDSTGSVVLSGWCPTHSVTGGESPD